MLVHFIWLGGKEIPLEYISNYNRCVSLNPNLKFKIWRDEDCLKLLEEHNEIEYWSKLTFICKYNFLKYLILGEFGGFYSDLDIYWNKSFYEILQLTNPNTEILATVNNLALMQMDGNRVDMIDDPFLYTKPGIFKKCLEYCKNRPKEDLECDGEHYLKTQEYIIAKWEPIGPFGMTKWIKRNNISCDFFYQHGNLDMIHGKFGFHKQINTWNTKN